MEIPGGLFSIRLPYDPDQPFRWPVSIAEVAGMQAALEDGLAGVARQAGSPRARNIYLIAFKWLLVECLSLLHACLILSRAQARGDQLMFSAEYPMFSGLQRDGVPYGDGVVPLRAKRTPAGLWPYSMTALRRMGRQVQWVGWRGCLMHRKSDAAAITVMAHNPLLLQALKADGRPVYYLASDRLVPASDPRTPESELTRQLHVLAEASWELIRELLARIGWTPSDKLRRYVLSLTTGLLQQVAQDYRHVERLWAHDCPRTLWTGSGGFYWARIARAIVQERGGEVVGFDHGGPTSALQSKDIYYIDGLFASRFITHTQAGAALYQENARYWPFGLPPLRVDGCPGNSVRHLRELVEREWAKPGSGKIRRVMYVGTVFRGERHWTETVLMDDAVYLDWQARLMATLVRSGVDVICKPHPGGMLKGRRLEYTTTCTFRYEPLEEIWDEADAFVFDYAGSTAFWHTLCTRKPVIWINHGLHPWHTEPYALIQRRCRIVDAGFDEDNRLQMDVSLLRRHLQEPPGEPDLAFVLRYMIGDPAKPSVSEPAAATSPQVR